DPPGSLQSLSEGALGAILVATTKGIRQLVDERLTSFPLPLEPAAIPRYVLRDADGALWLGTQDRGLLHVHNGRADAFAMADGLSGDQITHLFEDHEGNIWVATNEGLDRFRALPASTYSVRQGLPPPTESILADREEGVWITSAGGLRRWHDGRILTYRAQ